MEKECDNTIGKEFIVRVKKITQEATRGSFNHIEGVSLSNECEIYGLQIDQTFFYGALGDISSMCISEHCIEAFIVSAIKNLREGSDYWTIKMRKIFYESMRNE